MTDALFANLPTQVSLGRQVECVERELDFRRRVYARRVQTAQMTQRQADEEIAVMTAVRETLLKVKERANG